MKKRAIVHRHLKLQHHRHTGRVLRHQHTSYRGLAIIIALAGVLILTLNTMARTTAATMSGADTLTVTASNPAPLPTTPAVIINPANNAVVHKAQLEVSGTCQASGPPNIVTVLDNGQVAGSTPCLGDGTFSLSVVLELGKHTLIAQTYTITDGIGPDSMPVTVYYTVGSGGGGSPTTNNDDKTPLVVTADRSFIIYGPDKDAIWTGAITGGQRPYEVNIDWNDGNTNTYTLTESGRQRFAHRYTTMQPYVITLSVTDVAGMRMVRQYAAATPYTPPAIISPATPQDKSILFSLYGAYLLVLVIFGALWAGSHQSTYLLVPVPVRRRYATKHRHPARRSR